MQKTRFLKFMSIQMYIIIKAKAFQFQKVFYKFTKTTKKSNAFECLISFADQLPPMYNWKLIAYFQL